MGRKIASNHSKLFVGIASGTMLATAATAAPLNSLRVAAPGTPSVRVQVACPDTDAEIAKLPKGLRKKCEDEKKAQSQPDKEKQPAANREKNGGEENKAEKAQSNSTGKSGGAANEPAQGEVQSKKVPENGAAPASSDNAENKAKQRAAGKQSDETVKQGQDDIQHKPENEPAQAAEPKQRDNKEAPAQTGEAKKPQVTNESGTKAQNDSDMLRRDIRKKHEAGQKGKSASGENMAAPETDGSAIEESPKVNLPENPPKPKSAEQIKEKSTTGTADGTRKVKAHENGKVRRDHEKLATPQSAEPNPATGQNEPQKAEEAPLTDSGKEAVSTSADVQDSGENEQAATTAEPLPASDKDAQKEAITDQKVESVEAESGTAVKSDERPHRDFNRDTVVGRFDDRIVIRLDNGTLSVYSGDDHDRRLRRHARDVRVEELRGGRLRETISLRDGSRVVTIYNQYGDILRRSRFTTDGREIILVYVPRDRWDHFDSRFYRDPARDLPPLRLSIPRSDYIFERRHAGVEDYYRFLERPPVEPVQRLYSVDEVTHSARIRDKVRRIDLVSVNFDFGSAEISESEVDELQALAKAMNRLLNRNPGEMFLIEGHTDAVGSQEANLVLSDRRAEAVAEVLTDYFDIPPENMITQGYGERYLKIRTQAPERENRRVAVRRITPLVAPVNEQVLR